MPPTKSYYILSLLMLIILSHSCVEKKDAPLESAFSSLKGPYLGQNPPGKTPEIFAQGLISTSEGIEYGITISRDGLEIYFTRRSPEKGSQIYLYKYDSGHWVSKDPPLFGWEGEDFEPNFSPDEERLYFSSTRPMPGHPNDGGFSEWYIELEGQTWSVPKFIGSPILEVGTMFMTQANNGTIYFTGRHPKSGIYKAKSRDRDFEEAILLPDNINNFRNPAHPYIAPDESYIIYDYNINNVNGDRNLMLSFKKGGTWSDPINIQKYLGLHEKSNIPFVTFDQKYFFFSSGGNIYWVDASFIEELRPEN